MSLLVNISLSHHVHFLVWSHCRSVICKEPLFRMHLKTLDGLPSIISALGFPTGVNVFARALKSSWVPPDRKKKEKTNKITRCQTFPDLTCQLDSRGCQIIPLALPLQTHSSVRGRVDGASKKNQNSCIYSLPVTISWEWVLCECVCACVLLHVWSFMWKHKIRLWKVKKKNFVATNGTLGLLIQCVCVCVGLLLPSYQPVNWNLSFVLPTLRQVAFYFKSIPSSEASMVKLNMWRERGNLEVVLGKNDNMNLLNSRRSFSWASILRILICTLKFTVFETK